VSRRVGPKTPPTSTRSERRVEPRKLSKDQLLKQLQTLPEAQLQDLLQLLDPGSAKKSPDQAQLAAADLILQRTEEFLPLLESAIQSRAHFAAEELGTSKKDIFDRAGDTITTAEAGKIMRQGIPGMEETLSAMAGRDPAFVDACELLGVPVPDLAKNVTRSLQCLLDKAHEVKGEESPVIRLPKAHEIPSELRAEMTKNADAVFGPAPGDRLSRVLVTMPGAATLKPGFLDGLIEAGTDLFRINTSHDSPDTWKAIAAAIKTKAPDAKILVDTQGPKQRTGDIEPSFNAFRVHVTKDGIGNRVNRPGNGRLVLGLTDQADGMGSPVIPLGGVDDKRVPLLAHDLVEGQLRALKEGDRPAYDALVQTLGTKPDNHTLTWATQQLLQGEPQNLGRLQSMLDERGLRPEGVTLKYDNPHNTRGNRKLDVVGLDLAQDGSIAGLVCEAEKTVFFSPDTDIKIGKRSLGHLDEIPKPLGQVEVAPGETLLIKGDPDFIGHGARDGEPAAVGCKAPELLALVQEGEPVFIDDGSIRGIVKEVVGRTDDYPGDLVLDIQGDPAAGAKKIKPEKGINFPDTDLTQVSAFTPEDHKNLGEVLAFADVIAFSFAQTPADIRAMAGRAREILKGQGLSDAEVTAALAKKSINIKVETKIALEKLPEMLLAIEDEGMKPSVMIARGDFAVEAGFDRLRDLQEEVASICERQSVPYIYATQYFESLAKKDLNARSEHVDAQTAVKRFPPVVMLNKGPTITRAVQAFAQAARDAVR
jgi:pyruvate kinase